MCETIMAVCGERGCDGANRAMPINQSINAILDCAMALLTQQK